MQGWIVIAAWGFALVLALVVFGFVGFELRWKARRLAADRAELDTVVAGLTQVAAQLQVAAARGAALRSTSSDGA